MKFVYIEDDVFQRQVGETLLKRIDNLPELVSFEHCQGFIQAIDNEEITLDEVAVILTDNDMPLYATYQGYQLIKEVRDRGFDGLIIAISANKDNFVRMRDSGADVTIEKPFDKFMLDKISSQITKHLQSASA